MDSPCQDYNIGYPISRLSATEAGVNDMKSHKRSYRRKIIFSANLRTLYFLILYIIFVHCLLLFSYAEARQRRHEGYFWKADPWEDCSSENCDEKGVQFRQVYCAFGPKGRVAAASKCDALLEPRHQRVCIKVCHLQDSNSRKARTKSRRNLLAEWQTGPWKECSGVRCGEGGVQLRSVTCAYAGRPMTFPHSHCKGIIKPADQRPCFKICEEHRYKYIWQATDWDECVLVESRSRKGLEEDRCGLDIISVGLQSRNVSCVDATNSSIVMDDCICKSFSSPPVQSRSCDLPCPINCATTHWGSWSGCSRTCGNGTQHRTRNVLTTAKYGGLECPSLVSTRPCLTLPPCDPLLETFFSHMFKFDNWTECKPIKLEIPRTTGGKGRKHRKDHRKKLEQVDKSLIGGRTRHISCYNEGIRLGDRIAIDETCLIIRDCDVTEWSSWSDCVSGCGRPGNRVRIREVITLPAGPGAIECPHLEEIEECENSMRTCEQYTWVTGGWDECSTAPISNASCGGGIQNRHVYCVVRNEFTIYKASSAVAKGGKERLKEWAKMQPVDEDLCDQNYKPITWRECDVPCSSMCEVGEWSDWSECSPEVCSEDLQSTETHTTSRRRKNSIPGFKVRIRKITDSINGKEGCPHTKEFIPCEDSRCFRWHVNSSSSCQLHHGKCGTGDSIQNIVCRNEWGTDVDEKLCRKPPAAPMLNLTIPCYVACSSDCVVGEWSQWSPCTNDCKRGRRESGQQARRWRPVPQWRFREILANHGPGGKPCPSESELKETRPCNQHKCSVYYWHVDEWSDCNRKDDVTPSPSATGIRTSDMFMSDDDNSTHHEPLYFPNEDGDQVCAKGYQTRSVECKKKGSDTVNDKLCGQVRPKRSRECTFLCPKDCVLSEWGDWSDCDRECEKVLKSGGGVPSSISQHRQRVVIQHRTAQGEPCPLGMAERRLCTESEKCGHFRWHTTEWSECAKVAGTNSIFREIKVGEELKCLGAMSRQVTCHRGGIDGESIPSESRLCYKHIGKPPVVSRRCLVHCKEDRIFKNWMDRYHCHATLRDLETMEEIFGFSAMRYDNNSHVTMQKTAKPVGEWSSCNITQPNSAPTSSAFSKVSGPYCGSGVRQRALACYIEGTNIAVDISLCQYAEFQRESCEIPCPKDCKMSNWMSWKSCGDRSDGGGTSVSSPLCGNHLEIRRRYRIEEPVFNGRACPAIDRLTQEYESELCSKVCDELFWVPDRWTKCEINRNGAFSNCGGGYQTRQVYCYKTDHDSGYSDIGRIQEHLRACDLETMPYGYRQCSYPCPGECVYSEWSAWQKCEAKNGTGVCSGIRKRTRTVLRQVAPQTGRKRSRSSRRRGRRLSKSHCENAANTVITEPCVLNSNCFTYATMWTDWTSCKLPSGAECGKGVKRRKSNCISSNGLPVYEGRCTENGVTVPEPEHAECHVMCAIDCVVSPWSDWSICPHQCNSLSHRTRTRKIIRQPSVFGRPCHIIEEIDPCLPKPCHSWVLGEWSQCRVPGGNCGTGLKIRDVKCVQSDGIVVGNGLCKIGHGDLNEVFIDSELKLDCEIPCSGDCLMTEWSRWSDCHLRCINVSTPLSGIRSGTQTRSRVSYMIGQLITEDCPQREIEERECDVGDGTCFVYKWMTTPSFQNGHRPVWCERSPDGLNVSTGCDDQLKLREELYCTQNCEAVSHAYCDESGFCDCKLPYTAKRKTTGILLACETPPSNDDSETGEVTLNNDVTISQKTKISTTEDTVTVKVSSDVLNNLGLLTETGSLKVWVYGAIAGIVIFIIFIIASIYLMCVACRKKKQPQNYGLYSTKNLRRNKRRHNSSGSNVGVGMVVGSSRFPPSNSAMSHTSSTSRSGYSYRDNDDILWKEPLPET